MLNLSEDWSTIKKALEDGGIGFSIIHDIYYTLHRGIKLEMYKCQKCTSYDDEAKFCNRYNEKRHPDDLCYDDKRLEKIASNEYGVLYILKQREEK